VVFFSRISCVLPNPTEEEKQGEFYATLVRYAYSFESETYDRAKSLNRYLRAMKIGMNRIQAGDDLDSGYVAADSPTVSMDFNNNNEIGNPVVSGKLSIFWNDTYMQDYAIYELLFWNI